MNERIKELAEQAGQYAVSDNASMLFDAWKKRYTEKFAELIAGEVFAVLNDGTMAGEHYARKIEQQLGVSERDTLFMSDAPSIAWPKSRDVGRLDDMHQNAHLRVGLDGDNDVYLSIWNEDGGADIEFCTPGSGGGKSPRTREALIALMVAIEADNKETPHKDWWALRSARASSQEGSA